MSDPFLSEIRLFSFDFAPAGWAECNGQFMPINQNQALFSLLGTTFGGNGQTTFALPDLRGRVGIHAGSGHTLGERAGEQAHTVTIAELPTHTHVLSGSTLIGNNVAPRILAGGNVFAQDPGNAYSTNAATLTAFNPGSIANVGGSQAHQNMQPFIAVTFGIALQGLFPTPS